MQSPLISVIVPVYNVEEYLSKCIDSVLCQNYPHIEIILINDGSSDLSGQICDQYSSKFSNINVIHKENGGASEARNVGINNARGSYIMFLDGDDYWEGTGSINKIVERLALGTPDVVLYGCKDVDLKSGLSWVTRGYYNLAAIRFSKNAGIKSLVDSGQFPGSAWILAIRRSIVIEKQLFFVPGVKAEDIDWLVNVFYNVEILDAVNEPFYMYIKHRPGSLTATADAKSARGLLYSVSKWIGILEQDLNVANRSLLAFLAYQYLTSFIIYSKVMDTNKGDILRQLRLCSKILKYSTGARTLIGKMVISVFGYSVSSNIFRITHMIFNKWPALRRII